MGLGNLIVIACAAVACAGCASGLMVKASGLDAFDADCVAWNPAYRGGERAIAVRKRVKSMDVTTEDLAAAERDGLSRAFGTASGTRFPGAEEDDWLLVCRLRPAGTSRDGRKGE